MRMMMREEKEETMVMIATILIFLDWRINLPHLHLPYQGRVAYLLPTLILSITLKTAHLAASVVFFVVASTLKFNKYRTMKRKRRRRNKMLKKVLVLDHLVGSKAWSHVLKRLFLRAGRELRT